MARSIVLGAVLLALASSTASAQPPPPPTGYASASITTDVVLEPLLTAAEADLGRGELALALARATAVTAAVPPDSAAHVRAEGLILLARQRLGTTPVTDVEADVALAPLVDAAAADGPAGRTAVARARIEFVLARVSASSALATRATAIRAAIDAQAPVVTAPVVTAPVTTAPTAQQYQPIYGGAAPTYVYTTPGSVPQEPQLARGQTPEDPHRRGDAEIVELYITAGIFGGYLGAWVPWGSGAFDTSTGDEPTRLTALAVLIGGGVMVLGVFGLDQIDRGLRTGVPAGISMGIRYGLGIGMLSLGLYDATNSLDRPTALNIVGFSGLAGGLLGAALTMGFEPHPAQVQFTQTAGLWGALWGAQLALLIAPLVDRETVSGPFGPTTTETLRHQVGFGLTIGGLSAGLVTGLIFSAAHLNASARRSWHLTLGFLAGTGAGTAIWSLISALSGTLDVPTLGGCMFVGSIGGMVIAGLLSSGDRDRTSWDDPETEVPSVQVSISPTQGGGTVGLFGTF